MLLKELREQVLESCLMMLEFGLAQTAQGNISALDRESGYIAITPSALPYRRMKPEDICIIRADGSPVEARWKTTSETPLHLIFYRERADVGAVVHTHAPYASVFAVTHEPIPLVLTEAAIILGQGVPVAPYARPATDALARSALEGMAGGCAVLLAQHGLLTVGPDLHLAFEATLNAETMAKVAAQARAMGSPLHEVDPEEARVMHDVILKQYKPAH